MKHLFKEKKEGKVKKISFFDLPSRKQKKILEEAAKGTEREKKALIKKYYLRFSD